LGDYKETGLEDFIVDIFLKMHAKLEETKDLIPAGNYHEFRYEDLILDPEKELEKVYEKFGLGSYECNLQMDLKRYFACRAGYKPNTFVQAPELNQAVSGKLDDIIRQYDYKILSKA